MIIIPDNYRSEWIEAQDLETMLGITSKAAFSLCYNHRDQPFVDGTRVDYGLLKAIRDERNRLWNLAHNYYFYLSDQLEYKDIEIAEFLASHSTQTIKTWSSYLSTQLFGRIDELMITNVQINEKLVIFIKIMDEYMHELIRRKLYGSESGKD